MGGLEVICGCMFSGKTTALLQRLDRWGDTGLSVVALKPAIDDRYSTSKIVTHDGQHCTAMVVSGCDGITKLAADAQAVAIDEVHFFDDSIIAVCEAMIAAGKQVVCCGLDRDMWGDPFDHVAMLKQRGSITQLCGVCAACGQPADRTHRKTPLLNGHLVGGAEDFEPRCAPCFRPPPEPKPTSCKPGLAP
jgi:thymidine kinase